jgi:hypothetical protein
MQGEGKVAFEGRLDLTPVHIGKNLRLAGERAKTFLARQPNAA